MKQFLQERIDLARWLANSHGLGVRYEDVGLIACAVISACATERWPGRVGDRKRFIELLTQRSKQCFNMTWVSIPALLNSGIIRTEQTPYGIPGNMTRIYRGAEIDMDISVARQSFPNIPDSQLRKHCYASLIYDRLRCGYCHQYQADEDITPVSPSRRECQVSYIGRGEEMRRMICFDLSFLLDLAQFQVEHLANAPEPSPSRWWSTG